MTGENVVERLTKALQEAVLEPLATGKRVAIQLSGGLDSAILQALAQVDDLYCVTFPEVDNLTAAKLAAFGRDVKPVTFTKDEMIDVALPEVAKLTNGKGTWSQRRQWFIARAAAEDGVEMMLTGEGADEYFGGYARYRILWWLDQMMADPHLESYDSILNHMFGRKRTILVKMLSRTLPQDQAARMVDLDDPIRLLAESCASVEAHNGLRALLKFGRSMVEAHGMECDFPYMHPRVLGVAQHLTPDWKINAISSKVALRTVANDLGVHPAIINEQTKKGLFVPTEWRDPTEPPWSRRWFERLMEDAWERVKPTS
jgi:asparagine synthetase B (glutamine-hydrolysing)